MSEKENYLLNHRNTHKFDSCWGHHYTLLHALQKSKKPLKNNKYTQFIVLVNTIKSCRSYTHSMAATRFFTDR